MENDTSALIPIFIDPKIRKLLYKQRKVKKMKTRIELWTENRHGFKRYYQSITLDALPNKVWKAISNGIWDDLDLDIDELRSWRLRKGGK